MEIILEDERNVVALGPNERKVLKRISKVDKDLRMEKEIFYKVASHFYFAPSRRVSFFKKVLMTKTQHRYELLINDKAALQILPILQVLNHT